MKLATFAADATPALGTPLCAGLIRPAERVLDPLRALGIVIFPENGEAPIVMCALDWCEVCNADHALWRAALADAAGTSPKRVAVQCVHQHDAPLIDRDAEALLRPHGLSLMDVADCDRVRARVADAVRAALPAAQPVTHLTVGQASVERVASNRRVPAPDGTIRIRFSRCADPALRDAPEGEVDPELVAVAFWSEGRKLAALHHYAVHPMSYYGDGEVTADFVGIARDRCVAEDGGVPHLYFTGCAGDLTAGKYNDGAPENRDVLAERLYRAMRAAEAAPKTIVPDRCDWRFVPVAFPPRIDQSAAQLRATLANPGASRSQRTIAALWLAFLARTQTPVPASALHLSDDLCLLQLPGEALIAYQFFARALRPDATVAVAAYGDIGMSYIPLERHFADIGGYEESWAFAAPQSESVLKRAIEELVTR